MSRFVRIASAAALGIATVALPMTIAAPAHADAKACLKVLKRHDIKITAVHQNACDVGSQGDTVSCVFRLVGFGKVAQGVATEACSAAAQKPAAAGQ